jgi:hypothetical protein
LVYWLSFACDRALGFVVVDFANGNAASQLLLLTT